MLEPLQSDLCEKFLERENNTLAERPNLLVIQVGVSGS